MNVHISLATPADIPFIRQLAEKIWWAHYPEIISDDQIRYMLNEWYSEAALEYQMLHQQHDFWLIRTDGALIPVGYVAISQKEDEGMYYLHKFYLDNRGKGIGATAFSQALSHYPDMREMRLNVNRRNFRSVNFYFKMGFIIESIMDLPVGEAYIMDDFVMLYRKK